MFSRVVAVEDHMDKSCIMYIIKELACRLRDYETWMIHKLARDIISRTEFPQCGICIRLGPYGRLIHAVNASISEESTQTSRS